MGRKIVIFADGTGNSAASTKKTNVWRVYEALDLTGDDQVAIFDDGVGTSAFSPARYLGLAFGYGLKTNVLDLYKFLCRNYQDGDEIHCFGFSRGAFTIRLLVGLITRIGLVPRNKPEEDQDALAVAAYRAYRKIAFDPALLTTLVRAVRDRGKSELPHAQWRKPNIQFLGLWDTVGAYGLPIHELTLAVDRWIWPMVMTDEKLPEQVCRARHALALDDERRTFYPTPLIDPKQAPGASVAGANLDGARLIEAWFAGVHANVGGGYADDRLAHVSLCWMLREARQSGLRFDEEKLAEYAAYASPNGPIVDSRSGAGVFYRYHPRSVSRVMLGEQNERLGQAQTPLIHHSVVRRMADGADRYAPIAIDTDINVLDEGNQVIAFRHPDDAGVVAAETGQALRTLLAPAADAAARKQNREKREDSMRRAHDLVWWRRVDYLAMLTLALAFVLCAAFLPAPEYASVNGVFGDVLSAPLGAVGLVLPPGAAFLLAPLRDWPLVAVPLLVAFIGIYRMSGVLQTRIKDWAAAGWHDNLRCEAIRSDHAQKRQQIKIFRRCARLFWYVAVLMACVTAWDVGVNGAPMRGWNLAQLLAGVVAALGWTLALHAAQRSDAAADKKAPAVWWLLVFARRCRTSVRLVRGYRKLAQKWVPASFVVVVGLLVVVSVPQLLAQFWFQTRVALGHVCVESSSADMKDPRLIGGTVPAPKNGGFFPISETCWASGLHLREDGRYRLRLEIMAQPAGDAALAADRPGWFDRTTPADIHGLAWVGFTLRTSFLLKRWSGENWFQPIGRIGGKGITEFPLLPHAQPAAIPRGGVRAWVERIAAGAGKFPTDAPLPVDQARQIVAELDRAGARKTVLETVFRAPKTGELFLYVNDAVPFFMNFYGNNSGAAKVTLEWLE